MLRHVSLRTRILGLSLATIALGALVCAVLLVRLSAVQREYDALLAQDVSTMDRAREMQVTFKKQVQEWKDVLLRGDDPAAYEKYVTGFHGAEARVASLADSLGSDLATRPEPLEIVRRFASAHADLGSKYAAAMEQFGRDHDEKRADASVKGMDRPPTDMVDTLVARLHAGVASRSAELAGRVRRERVIFALVLVVGFSVLLGVALVLVRLIMVRVSQVVDRARQVAELDMRELERAGAAMAAGDLEQRARLVVEPMEDDRRDELGDLARALDGIVTGSRAVAAAFETAQTNMHEVLGGVAGGIEAARVGELDHRLAVDRQAGAFRSLGEGMNALLAAVATPLAALRGTLEQVAARDLTARAPQGYEGEYGRLSAALNAAVENLDAALREVSVATVQVSLASGEITAGSQKLAGGAGSQASTLEEVGSSLQELASMSRRNAENTEEASGLTKSAHSSVAEGVAGMQTLSEAMERIRSSSLATSRIVKTIDEIAFQTNLLALNAAVEAARAGDSGKGFAVVADEVRALALRSAEAARNTAELIEQGVRSAEDGTGQTGLVMGRLGDLQQRIDRISQVMAELAAASEQESQGIGQIAVAVEQLNATTQDVAAMSEESAATAEELNAQVGSLRSLVGDFVVGGAAAPAVGSPAFDAPARRARRRASLAGAA